jgi:hypothetical protein
VVVKLYRIKSYDGVSKGIYRAGDWITSACWAAIKKDSNLRLLRFWPIIAVLHHTQIGSVPVVLNAYIQSESPHSPWVKVDSLYPPLHFDRGSTHPPPRSTFAGLNVIRTVRHVRIPISKLDPFQALWWYITYNARPIIYWSSQTSHFTSYKLYIK